MVRFWQMTLIIREKKLNKLYKIKAGDFIFVWSNSFFAWIVSWFSKVPHVAIAISENSYIEADFLDGVRISDISNLDEKRKVEIYSLNVSEDKKNIFIDELLEEVGRRYDVAGLIAYLTGLKLFQNSKRWFCSELVAMALKKAGIITIRGKSYKVSPEDIYKWITKIREEQVINEAIDLIKGGDFSD